MIAKSVIIAKIENAATLTDFHNNVSLAEC